MRIAAIVRSDNVGLGIQSKEFFDHIPCKALVVDVSKISSQMPQNHGWYPNQTIWYYTKGAKFPRELLDDFLKDIDVLIAFETCYDYGLFAYCRLKGIKTILQLNYEFLEYPSNFSPPDLFAAPSMWHFNDIPFPKVYLPVPVNTKKFVPQKKEKTFLHIAGKPAIHDRNGTYLFLNCLQYVKNDITVILKCQREIVVPEVPQNVTLIKDFTNNKNYQDNYDGGVLVMPRKYGGLCLPCQEAIAAEMPVIMPDISPNNLWLPKDWLVPAEIKNSFKCKRLVDIYEVEEKYLAAKIDLFCEKDIYNGAIEQAKELKDKISWEKLLPLYYETFNNVLNNG